MRRLKMVLALAALVIGSAFAAPAASAGGFCGPEDGCSPCSGEIVIDGKNTRIEFHQC
ncbi:MAG TPA: hypothetical protein VM840_00615 [Actinomycetota bacterium]|nr:hypothetical protein [Actinomycetota bacterium]